jgi:hypothetical protein
MILRAPDIGCVNVHGNLYEARGAEWILDLNLSIRRGTERRVHIANCNLDRARTLSL